MSVRIDQADVLEWAQGYAGEKFHALLADGPYSLGNGKQGFMGKQWDTNICFKPDTWKMLAQHLLPGAFGMVFGSSRGWHRLACAIEDAGLTIHPSVFMFGWSQGSGFPKSTKIDDERFSGHRYGLQSLKPALEPIICFQKAYEGSAQHSIVQHGAGALNIDGARLPTSEQLNIGAGMLGYHGADGANAGMQHPAGRWPPNFALCHTPQCQRLGPQRVQGSHVPGPALGGIGYHGVPVASHHKQHYAAPDGTELVEGWDCHESCPVAALNRQAGVRTSVKMKAHDTMQYGNGGYFGGGLTTSNNQYGDTGPASRFFSTHDWTLDVAEQLAGAAPVYYAGKASRSDRDKGLEGMSAGIYPRHNHVGRDLTNPHNVLPGGARSRLARGEAARIPSRNSHPCVKPLSLCRWLATLLLPPAAYAPRRILCPFSGSGSEMIGAFLAGWEEIVGVEREPEYVSIARQRIAYWQAQPRQEVLL